MLQPMSSDSLVIAQQLGHLTEMVKNLSKMQNQSIADQQAKQDKQYTDFI